MAGIDELLRRLQVPFTREEVAERGGTRHVLQRWRSSGAIVELAPGVFRPAHVPLPWELAAKAAARWAGPDATLSHETAAALHGFAGYARAGDIHLSVPGTPKAPRTRDFELVLHCGRALEGWDVEVREGLRVTRVERTLVDLARGLDERGFERLVADALEQKRTKAHRLRACLKRLEHRQDRGLRELRALFARRGWTLTRLESVLEQQFAALFLAEGLPAPVEQYEWPEKGRPAYRLDFAWPEQKLAVEADSYQYHSNRKDWAKDQTRLNELVSDGWSVLRFTQEDLAEPKDVAHLVQTALYNRGWEP